METNEVVPTISRTWFFLEERLGVDGKIQFRWDCSDKRFISPDFSSSEEARKWHFGPLGIAERSILLNPMNENEPPTEIIEKPSPDTDLDEPLPERKCSLDGEACESCQ